jgi:hypothetical protein
MSEPGSKPNRDTGTYLALVMLLLLGGGFLFIIAMVMPDVILFLLVPCGLFGLGILHWLVWGWWLSKWLPRERDD